VSSSSDRSLSTTRSHPHISCTVLDNPTSSKHSFASHRPSLLHQHHHPPVRARIIRLAAESLRYGPIPRSSFRHRPNGLLKRRGHATLEVRSPHGTSCRGSCRFISCVKRFGQTADAIITSSSAFLHILSLPRCQRRRPHPWSSFQVDQSRCYSPVRVGSRQHDS
jgi:hypothetical protein